MMMMRVIINPQLRLLPLPLLEPPGPRPYTLASIALRTDLSMSLPRHAATSRSRLLLGAAPAGNEDTRPPKLDFFLCGPAAAALCLGRVTQPLGVLLLIELPKT